MTDQPKIEHKWVGGELWRGMVTTTPPLPDDLFREWKTGRIEHRETLDHVARLYEERNVKLGMIRDLRGMPNVDYVGNDGAGSVNEVSETLGDAQEGAGSNPARSEPFPILVSGGVPQITDEGDNWNVRIALRIDRIVAPGTSYSTGPHTHAFELPKNGPQVIVAVIGGEYSAPLDIAEEVRKAGYKP